MHISVLALSAIAQSGTSFDLPLRLDAGAPTVTHLDAADLNGDGWPDLFLTLDTTVTQENEFRQGGRFAIAFATGPGEWPEEEGLTEVPLDGFGVGRPALGDIDGDGDVDAAVASQELGRVILYLLINDGAGSMSPVRGPALIVGSTLQLADGDGDGDLDVFGRSGPREIAWIEVIDGVPGSVTRRLEVAAEAYALGDMDQDGVVDIVGVGTRIEIRSGATGAITVVEDLPAGAAPAAVRVMLVDPGLVPDFVVETDQGALVYAGDGMLGGSRLPLDPGVLRIDGVRRWRTDPFSNARAIYTESFLFPRPPALRRAFFPPVGGNGGFPGTFDFPAPDPEARLRDVDDDGLEEWIEGDLIREFSRVPGTSRVIEEPGSTPLVDRGPARRFAAFDVDLDGVLDIVFLPQAVDAPRVQLNTGAGRFAASLPLRRAPTVLGVLTGIKDLISVAADVPGGDSVLALLGADGRVIFCEGESAPDRVSVDRSRDLDLGGLPPGRISQGGDIDGDGVLDVLVATGTRYDWTPVFGSAPTLVGSSDVDPALGDLDGDGDLDFIGLDGDAVTVSRTLPQLMFSSPAVVHQGLAGVRDLAAADLDQDGRVDIVVRTQGEVLALRNRGAFVFDAPVVVATLPALSGPTARVDIRDVDQDGVPDLVLTPFNEAVLVGTAALISDGAFGVRDFVPVFDKTIALGAPSFADLDGDGDLDALGLEPEGAALFARNRSRGRVGEDYCSLRSLPSGRNSTGVVGRMAAFRPDEADPDVVRLIVSELPQDVFGMIVGSPDVGVNFAGASGGTLPSTLCLRTMIGRYDAPGEVRSSGASGRFTFDLDRRALRTPTGSVAALAGETWYFQAWHRDLIFGETTSRFTEGLAITFE